MDDEKLTVGKEYLFKLGTRKIPGIIQEILYRTDVNTGAHLKDSSIEKNEIAECKIEFAEKIVVDTFLNHKTLGEMILIDRVTHMTSACGVVETVDESEEKPYFENGELKAGGYIFEELYFNLDRAVLSKAKTEKKTYHVGDEVPVKGNSFHYPDYFDIISLESKVVVQIRDKHIYDIISLSDYQYMGLPVVDEKGFSLKISSGAQYRQFVDEYEQLGKEEPSEFHNKWSEFETFRSIVCTDNFWII